MFIKRGGFGVEYFFRKSVEYHYDVFISVIPKKLGSAKAIVQYESPSPQRKSRKQEFSFWNGHCRGAVEKIFPFTASPGWSIESNSIRPTCRASRSSRCVGLRNVQALSFGYACHIENRGKCFKLVGAKDARGHCGGAVKWDEVKSSNVLRKTELPSVQLYWGKDEQIELIKGTKSVQVIVEKIDGNRRIFTTTDVSDPWVHVNIDFDNRRVILRPNDIDTAMR